MALEGVPGRDGLLRRSLNIEAPIEAILVLESTLMLVALHEEQSLARVVGEAPLPGAVTQDNAAICPMALDHVFWTEGVADAVTRLSAAFPNEEVSDRTIRIAGKVSRKARSEFRKAGWKVEAKSDDHLQ